jgi:hypothetical protein
LTDFIGKADMIHNHKYDYTESVYKNNDTKIQIVCKTHGPFWQTPAGHLVGRGCPKCGTEASHNKRVKDKTAFIEEARTIHSGFYNYSLVDYIGAHTDIIIVCPKHGNFVQRESAHLSGQKYPKCSNNFISRIEMKWLDSLDIPIEYRQKSLTINGKKYRVDAFSPVTNTIYEFYGDFWHGNPEVYDPSGINWKNKMKP